MRTDSKRPAPVEGAGLIVKREECQRNSAAEVYSSTDRAGNEPEVKAVYCFDPFGHAVGADIQSFCARHPNSDIYRLLGEPHELTSQKPKKTDMLGSWRVWVELDPPPAIWNKKTGLESHPGALKEWRPYALEKLRAYRLPPTAIVDSGRGYWGEWRLDALALPAAVEAVNKGLIAEFLPDADRACFNIDRVGRMWGTRNSKTGEIAVLLEYHPYRVYKIADFPIGDSSTDAPKTEADEKTCDAAPVRTEDLDALKKQYRLRDDVCLVISRGKNPERPNQFPSRSEAVFYVCCELIRSGVPDGLILGLLLDSDWAIADSVLFQHNGRKRPHPEEYARRQVAQAHAAVESDRDGDGETQNFECDDKGKPLSNQRNIRAALKRLSVSVRHDTFQDRLTIKGLEGFGPHLDDRAMRRLWLLIENRFRFRPSKDFFWDVVQDLAHRNGFHPVREYLDGLLWDGEQRLDRWLVAYAGAEDTDYVRAVGSLMLVAAVRRIRKPGCKFDEMPVLEGVQGTNKSSALAILAVNEDWFSDDVPLNANGQRVIEALAGKWIVEAAELNGMRKGEVEHLKALLSRQIDRSRMAYDRLVKEVPRECVLIGTTNSAQYLRDATGNRRFWPVAINGFDLPALRRDRDQLWAEAALHEAAGASIRLDPRLWKIAAAEQAKRAVDDPYLLTLAARLGDRTGKIRAIDVFELLGIPPGLRSQEQNARVGEAMRALGFERHQRRFGGKRPEWAYVRGQGAETERTITPSPSDEIAASGSPTPF